MNEPLTAWGEAELAAENAHEAAKAREAEWHALADDMLAAADTLERVSAQIYGESRSDHVKWSAHELRTESIHVRAEGNTDE